MIGLALSGGGSRAIAFHLGCLRALRDIGVLDQVGVISTISGGSVIGAYYAYTPGMPFEEFDTRIRALLRRGIQRDLVRTVVGPRNIARVIQRSVSRLLQRRSVSPHHHRHWNRTDILEHILQSALFPNLTMSSPRRNDVDMVIGACELRTGTAFRFGNASAGTWRYGELVDWDVDVSLAVAASAAYPLFLPSLDRTWKYRRAGAESCQRTLLADGGVYDNLGVSVLEPHRSSDISIHRFDCEYLIACSAGQGQDSGGVLPLNLFTRLDRTFGIVHRRVQDSTMRRLHHLNDARLIKGFALPYLGQQDRILPVKPADLVPREAVVSFPTNFRAMSDSWIEALSRRGEQLTRLLVSHYLPEICR